MVILDDKKLQPPIVFTVEMDYVQRYICESSNWTEIQNYDPKLVIQIQSVQSNFGRTN